MLEQITNSLLELVDKIGLVGIFIATAIESFFAPIPSEIVLFTAGLYAKSQGGIPELLAVSVVAALGSFVGTLPFYLISRYSADSLLPKFIDKVGKYLLISHEDLEKANKLFEKRGSIMVFVSRLIPGIRSLVAFPAGVAKMNFLKYTIFTLLGSFLWNILLASIGYLSFDKKDEFFKLIDPVENVVIAILVIASLVYIYKIVRNYQKIKKNSN